MVTTILRAVLVAAIVGGFASMLHASLRVQGFAKAAHESVSMNA